MATIAPWIRVSTVYQSVEPTHADLFGDFAKAHDISLVGLDYSIN